MSFPTQQQIRNNAVNQDSLRELAGIVNETLGCDVPSNHIAYLCEVLAEDKRARELFAAARWHATTALLRRKQMYQRKDGT